MQKKERKKESTKEGKKERKFRRPEKFGVREKMSLDDYEKCFVRRIFLKRYDLNRNFNLEQTSSGRKKYNCV
jgi:hypothetical protein